MCLQVLATIGLTSNLLIFLYPMVFSSSVQPFFSINLCTVENENIDRFDHDNLMEFDERGRLRPKNSQKVLGHEIDMTHAPKLELKVKNSHENSPEKLSCQSKISIFEMSAIGKMICLSYGSIFYSPIISKLVLQFICRRPHNRTKDCAYISVF